MAGNLQCKTQRIDQSNVASGWQLDTADPYVFPEYPVHYFSEGNLLTMESVDTPNHALTFIVDREFVDALFVDDQFEIYVYYFNDHNPTSPSIMRPIGRLVWNWGGQVVFDSPGIHTVRFSNAIPQSRSGGPTNSTVSYQGNVRNLSYVPCPGSPTPTTNPMDGSLKFVNQQYSDFLGYNADELGLKFWASQISTCAFDFACIRGRRSAVSKAFFDVLAQTDPEMQPPPGAPGFSPAVYNRKFMYYCYQKYFGRNPDQGGWDFWTDYLNSSGDYLGVIDAFITWPEYRDRFQLLKPRYQNLCAGAPIRRRGTTRSAKVRQR